MLYYEDLNLGDTFMSSAYTVDRDEMVTFAEMWDPLPFHVDEVAAKEAFGGLIAPGLYVLAVKQKLIQEIPPFAVIASFGYDEVRFHEPVRPNDSLRLEFCVADKRESASKPDRGIVSIRLTLINQHDVRVMSHIDNSLLHRREPGSASPHPLSP